MTNKKPLVIGIAGGSGSGKTTVTKKVFEVFRKHSVVVIEQDYYYKDQSHLPFEKRLETNYDHPFAFDNDLFIEQIEQLLRYEAVETPTYDYSQHTRAKETRLIEPRDVLILEGMLILDDPRIRELMDIKIYVDTDADLRILRRITRDMKERDRSLQSIIDQYVDVVRPMHNQFIEPTKRYADIIVPEGGQNEVAIDLIVTKIKSIVEIDK